MWVLLFTWLDPEFIPEPYKNNSNGKACTFSRKECLWLPSCCRQRTLSPIANWDSLTKESKLIPIRSYMASLKLFHLPYAQIKQRKGPQKNNCKCPFIYIPLHSINGSNWQTCFPVHWNPSRIFSMEYKVKQPISSIGSELYAKNSVPI